MLVLFFHEDSMNPNTPSMALHVGDKISLKKFTKLVNRVQADGHELELIESSFSGIPQCKNSSVCVWTGDFAKFICNNLVL